MQGTELYNTVISIHAPTKGATAHGREDLPERAISIHAPTKGATGKNETVNIVSDFNPRSHEGSDF